MSDSDGTSSGDAQLFAIFSFAFLLLFLIPATIWRVCSGGGAKVDVVQPWKKDEAARPSLSKRVGAYVNGFNVVLVLLWVTIAFLGVYISSSAIESEQPFNPFTILGIPEDATEAVIKKAHKTLTLKWHPDKHKGEEAKRYAAQMFDDIVKAKNALTDETARENWLKHGHPDGPQGMSIGVALPEWIFASGKTAPLVLLALVFIGLAAPILLIAYYLNNAERYVGANKVMEETLVLYHRFGVKEMLRVPKMYEAIVPAKEFVRIPITPTTASAVRTMTQAAARQYDTTRLPKWWHPEMLRTYLFLVAYLDRNNEIVPPELQKDLAETLRLVPIMCEEFVKASCVPRNRFRRGWFLPAEAAMQFQQCVVQQVRPEILVPAAEDKKKKKAAVGESAASLLQLPGVTVEVVRALDKNSRIRSLQDLAALSAADRDAALAAANVAAGDITEVQKMLLAMPHVHITRVSAFVEEEDDIKEGDLLTVHVWVAITRPQHAALAGVAPARQPAAGVQAFTPRFPHTVTEKWSVFLTNQRVETPSTWGHVMPNFADAEKAGVENYAALGCQWAPGGAPAQSGESTSTAAPANGSNGTVGADGAEEDAEPEPIGQKLEFKYMLQEVGKFKLTLAVMPSCWLACNASAPVNFTVLKQTAAEKAGKGPLRGKDAKQAQSFLDPDEVDDGDSEDDESDDDDSEGWDSDETGTDISHDEEPEDPEADSAAATKKPETKKKV